jgi:voltage-gated potassium channel
MIHAVKFRLKISLIVFLGVMVFGTLGFMMAEGKSLLDAAYFVIVTMATVGYGDIHPIYPTGKFLAIAIIVLGVGTFLGVIANTTELMLSRKIQQTTLEKLNMVIGVFFSEVGTKLIGIFTRQDSCWESMRQDLMVTNGWKAQDFVKAGKEIKKYTCEVSADRGYLETLRAFLVGKRDFLVALLENPILMEHETFTDLLRAVFHLTEELSVRGDLRQMPESDLQHIAADIQRAYRLLSDEWLVYMKYLKDNYPYLYSLAVRLNPFNPEASPTVMS